MVEAIAVEEEDRVAEASVTRDGYAELDNPKIVTMGRLVRFRMLDGSGERVAIVTRVHNQNCVNLFILMDASDDFHRGITAMLGSSVVFGLNEGQWRWPVISHNA